jgi:hypothetical protein
VILISESHGDSNRYTPYRGKPDQHATCIPCLVHVWSQTIHISRGQHIATFREVINNDGQSHHSREKGPPTQSTTRRLPDPWVRTKFLSWASHWSSGDKTTPVDVRLLGLLGLYHQHDIGTFNTCSRGPTHWSLIDTSGGYSLEGTGFPHTTLRPSQPTVSPFHLRAPPDL